MSEEILDALKKCAVGLSAGEVVEEYGVEDGELKLIKKKVTRRDVPPDIKAVKMLLEEDGCAALSDEQLEKQREELALMLKEIEDD